MSNVSVKYNETDPSLTDGQSTDLQGDATGALKVTITAIGSPDDAAWDGVAAEATVIALLKAIAINTATP